MKSLKYIVALLILICAGLAYLFWPMPTLYTATKDANSESGIFIPSTLEEAHQELDRGLSAYAKNVLVIPKDDMSNRQLTAYRSLSHHGFGRWMRNNWGLWNGGTLYTNLNAMGLTHPDDMSSIIMDSYVANLKGETFPLKEEIKEYQLYWENVIPNEVSPLSETD